MDRDRDDSGQFETRVSLENILEEGFGTNEPRSTTEIADQFDLSQSGAYAKLNELADQEKIEKKKLGGYKGVVWWKPQD